MKIKYEEFNFQPKTMYLINQVNAIVDKFQKQGYSLTLRQVYYQLVSQNIIENNMKSYDRLGVTIGRARLNGLVSWHSIEDRTRNLRGYNYYDTPEEVVRQSAQWYAIDPWLDQEHYVEVWVEKDALIDVVGKAAGKMRVNYFSCRGYVSLSEMWEAARRLMRHEDDGKQTVIIHLGDHDPSGKDMSRDILERLEKFGANPTFERIALNMDQIDQYSPPPNPAKITDSRAKEYIRRYGSDSWELDALQPQVINQLITDKVTEFMDKTLFDEAMDKEREGSQLIHRVANNWDKIVDALDSIEDWE